MILIHEQILRQYLYSMHLIIKKNSYSADFYSTSSCSFQGEEIVVANLSANDFSADPSCLSNVINEAVYNLCSPTARVISDNSMCYQKQTWAPATNNPTAILIQPTW